MAHTQSKMDKGKGVDKGKDVDKGKGIDKGKGVDRGKGFEKVKRVGLHQIRKPMQRTLPWATRPSGMCRDEYG
jgi:hypothetical protein